MTHMDSAADSNEWPKLFGNHQIRICKANQEFWWFYPAQADGGGLLIPAEIVGQGPKGGRSLPHLTNVNAGQTNVNVCCFRGYSNGGVAVEDGMR